MSTDAPHIEVTQSSERRQNTFMLHKFVVFATVLFASIIAKGQSVNPGIDVNWPAACNSSTEVYVPFNNSCIVSGGGGGGMSNPMNAAGDMIDGGTGGTPQRLPIGSNGQVLTVVSGAPAWAAGGGSQFSIWNLPNTPPVCSSFTQTNFTNATCASKSNRMVEIFTPTTSGGIAALVANAALPATPYTVDVCFAAPAFISGGASFTGLFLEASGGALLTYETRFDASGSTTQVSPYLEVENWASFTSFTSGHFAKAVWDIDPGFSCQRITDDGTHRTYWVSQNGSDYAQVYQEATNTTITPVSVGFGIVSNNTSNVLGPVSVYYWNVANSILPNVGP